MFKFPTNIFAGDLSDKNSAVLVSGVSKDTIVSSTLCKVKSSLSFLVGVSLLSVSLLLVGCGGSGDEDEGVDNVVVEPTTPPPPPPVVEKGYYSVVFYDKDLNYLGFEQVLEGSNANITDIRKKLELGGSLWYAAGGSTNVAYNENYPINGNVNLYAVAGVAEINTQAKLYAIVNNPAGKYILTSDIELSIDAASGWEPISIFKGILSGGASHHVINGLWTNRNTANVGLFGVLDGAQVKNLGVVLLQGRGIRGGQYTGGIAGRLINTSHISDSYVIGDVSGDISSSIGGDRIGGIAGRIESGSKVTGSYSAGSVKGYERVGGLVGQMLNNCEISNSYSTADVEATGYYAGGILGAFEVLDPNSKLFNTYARGRIKANGEFGGIVGWAYGEVISNVAINPSVKHNNNALLGNRVIGYADVVFTTFKNNLAFEGMTGRNDEVGNFIRSNVERNHGISKSDDALKKMTTYEAIGWNFTRIWSIDEKIDYPRLKWER
ncbi:MAG: hypothetical protein LBQ18_00680 [Campylobacteraceae bacterium]|jgi:hypothetical protein|nr:hypothetical protein [Campylobacteraceae bacterium]